MKKLLIIIPFLIIIIVVIIFIFQKDEKTIEEKLKDMGYNNKEIKEIMSQPTKAQNIILKNEYNKKIINILTSKNYDENNLSLYLDYYDKNKNADITYVIDIVNNDLTDKKYSDFLGQIAGEKYFIKANVDRYLAYNDGNSTTTVQKVNCNLDYEYYTHTTPSNLEDKTQVIVNKYYYLDKNYEPDDLIALPDNYNMGKNNKLRKDAYDAFIEMADAAMLDNISIKNASGYRSYDYQANLYNNYVKKDGKAAADTYSARAGFSEHQTGLATDINQVNTSFENTDAFKWLSNNAYKYGFILRYPKNKEDLTGYKYEPWHYRFVGKDAAKKITEENITYEEYYAYYVKKS